MDNFEQIKFEQLKESTEIFYKNLGEVFCPYFKERVIFNAKGLEHIKFKAKNRARSQIDQLVRFKLLHLAPRVIEVTRTIQGISKTSSFEWVRSNSRTECKLKSVSYYEFIAILDDKLEKKRIRVVVKQIENSPKYFWSVIPFWKMDKINNSRKMNSGNLESE